MSAAVAQLLSLLIASNAGPRLAATNASASGGDAAEAATPGPAVAPAPAPAAAPGPPGDAETATVDVTPDRYTLTLGADAGATLSVTVHGPDAGGAWPGRVFATTGTIEPLIAGAAGKPGTFTALYHAPTERYPQAAIVV